MFTSTTSASRWPARAAWLSAAIFSTASISTNTVYGWSKGTDLPTSIIWAGVAAAVAVVFGLSWPALIQAVERRRWSAALVALAALLLSGAYSVTAALGSASGGRTQAANEEKDTTDARARAQAAYDAAKAELAKLAPARTIGELEALKVQAQRQPQRFDCAAVNGSLALSCPKLDAELSRARTRERLQAALDKASADLSAVRPTKVANSDAAALQRYLKALGADISTERLNDLLVLLTVFMVEAGGGLSMALGMALSGPASRPVQERTTVGDTRPDTGHVSVRPPASAPVQLRPSEVSELTDWLRGQGGKAETSMRRLASVLGRSSSGVHEEIRRLVALGAITSSAGPRGTMLALSRPS
ncbi:MAG: hypothetical protein EKK41_16870 [Hyphomicrobiales bacterium]|nr:MAG: hypothetical protein EKK41_16870 [Hyphomicrobiales bacterium]